MFGLFKKKGPWADKATRRTIKSLFWADSGLVTSGWFESVRQGMAVDAKGEPIPWWTYPSIAFLAPRLTKEMRVFEFGSGHSTLWLSRRVRSVVSCEHDRGWFDRMKPALPANVQYRLREDVDSGAYARDVLDCEGEVDLVVVDGRDRVACARHAVSRLSPGGVILWDNSERQEYEEGFALLRSAGFKRLDFEGMGPINVYQSRTSVFYRVENVLGI